MTSALTLFDFPATRLLDTSSIVRALADALRNGAALNMPAIAKAAKSILGADDGSGIWSPRDAYDWAEAAAVEVVRGMCLPDDPPQAILGILDDLMALLPRQARRTDTTEAFQAFSTPLPLGFLAARAAQIDEDDAVLEPSAGTGMLAVFARRARRLLLNELEPQRRDLLGALGETTGHDALYLRALLHAEEPPSVVLMNPPFSADANVRGVRRGGLDLRHVAQAFGFLRPGGRLVTLLGSASSYQRDPRPYRELRDASLVASIVVGGAPFARMGTSISCTIAVLDYGARTEPPILPEREVTLADALDIIDSLPARLPLGQTQERAATVIAMPARSAAMPDAATTQKEAATSVIPCTTAARPMDPTPVTYDALEPKSAEIGDGIFEPYTLQRIAIHGAQGHPTPLVESTSLRSVIPPVPSHQPLLPSWLLRDAILSDAQTEAVIYAGNAHASHIDLLDTDDQGRATTVRLRQGFLIGDGGGVGKGRTTSAIILDNFAHGRTKAVWVSETEALLEDARRDWSALGGDPKAIALLGSFKLDAEIGLAHGIVFTTYATLRSRSKKTNRSRLDQLVSWLGKDFAGAIVFDESHNLQNAAPAKRDRGIQKPSLQGQAALDLQRQIPEARFVYQSATSASRIEAFSYAPRLGLWRVNGAFPDRATFLAQMEAGGLAAMEIVSRDLKAQGLMCARALSMEGVTYERLVHSLDDNQLATYAAANEAWRIIDANVREALEMCDANNGHARGAALSALESTKQRFYGALLVSFKLPTAIAHAKEQIALGHSPVFQLTSTNEAVQERVLARRDDTDDLEDLDLSPREYILDYLRNAFPVTQHREEQDADGNTRSVPLTDAAGNPIVNPDAVAAREALIERLTTLMTPDGPLDLLLEAFGADNLAEITGRKRRLIHVTRNGERSRVIDERGAHVNVAETAAFMNDTKRCLVFSEGCGGTGRSYHADKACKNQRKRIHYLLQAGWRSDRALQGLWRTKRTNQAQDPDYILVTTNVPGERRFISTIARRLDQLGALTRGQRDASGNGLFSAADNLETTYGSDALASLLRQIAENGLPGFPYADFKLQTNLDLRTEAGQLRTTTVTVPRFLNRLLAVDIDAEGGKQGVLMDALEHRMEELVAHAKHNGVYDAGVQTIAPLHLRLKDESILATDAATGAATTLLTLERADYAKSFSFADVRRGMHRFLAYHRDRDRAGYFQDDEGPVAVIPSSHLDRGGRRTYWIVRPFTEESVGWPYLPHAKAINERTAETLWTDALRAKAEIETTILYVVSGTLLTVWHRLPSDSVPIVYTMRTDDGKRIIGRVLDASQAESLRTAFGLDGTADLSAADACALARSGQLIDVSGVGSIRRVRVSNTKRLELVVADPLTFARFATACGAIVETIDYRKRIFLPSGREGDVLAALARGARLKAA